MRTEIRALIVVFLGITLAGCGSGQSTHVSGVVGFKKDHLKGETAPDIPFVSMEGKQTSLWTTTRSIWILAFVNTPDQACFRLAPELVTMASRFRNDPITIAQISYPFNKCPQESRYTESNLGIPLALLCDADQIAWKAYNNPKPNTIILIDDNKIIVEIGSMEDLELIANKAQTLAMEVEQKLESMYH